MSSCNCQGLGMCPVCDWKGFRVGCRKRNAGPRPFDREGGDEVATIVEDEALTELMKPMPGALEGALFFLGTMFFNWQPDADSAENGLGGNPQMGEHMPTKTAKKTPAKKGAAPKKPAASGARKTAAAKGSKTRAKKTV